ncbi:unnamed protein product [Paramecium sonneborni]|uniref:Uncharacterized protein n=1 Tax=Paramecium sonneborni TaxID=65129 RepID=A0A8S1LGF2_9CILI|nr:unnamed protein product [Paramecium sonneborni]
MQFQQQYQTQTIIEQLIKENDSDLLKLLLTDSFMSYCRNTDPYAIEFICNNVDKMLNILFVDYNLIPKEQLEQQSELINNIWEIIELNLEPILKQIENYWSIIFDLRWKQLVPDTQWGIAYKLLNIVKERDPQILNDFSNQSDFLVSFLPYLKIHSVSQILVAFFEIGFHQQQLDFLKKGLELFKQNDILSVINFTYIVHEIMTRILIHQLIEYILNEEFLKVMFDIIEQDEGNPIILKSAAHMISLISNYYTIQMQQIDFDDPDCEELIAVFKETSFFANFDIQKIHQIFKKQFSKKKVRLFIIKLIEIVENLVRITDLQLWDRIADSNIMESIFELVNHFKVADIFRTYVENMIIYIFDKALNDSHPFWAYYLISRYRLQNKNIGFLDRLIYQFQVNLEWKLSDHSQYQPYEAILKEIDDELKISKIWNIQKRLFINQEEKNKIKLGEDSSTIKTDSELREQEIEQLSILEDERICKGKSAQEIISGYKKYSTPSQLFQEVQLTVFDDVSISKNEAEFDFQSNSEDNDKINSQTLEFSGDRLDIQRDERVMQYQNKNNLDIQKKNSDRMSTSLQYDDRKIKNLSSSLQSFDDINQNFLFFKRKKLKRENKNLKEFKIEILKNTKVLKKQDNSILKVDEIDFQSNLKLELKDQIDPQQEKQQNSQIK